MQLLLVKWLDAQDFHETWGAAKDIEAWGETSCEIVSVGWEISRTAKYLTIGSDFDASDNDWGTVRKIPSSMLVSIEDITPPVEPAVSKP